MQKSLPLVFLACAVAAVLAAQTTHSATLTWTDTLNSSGTTYNVYGAPGLCSGAPVFAKLASSVAVLNYVDTTVTQGTTATR